VAPLVVSNIAPQFLGPVIAGLASAALAIGYYKIPLWPSGLCFALCGFVVGTIGQEFYKGAAIRSRNSGTDLFTALVGLVGKNKRRYGGYIVHVGIVLICFGFAGNARKLDEQMMLKLGQETKIGKYTIKSNGVKLVDDGQKQMTTAYLTVFADGKRSIGCIRRCGVSPPRAGADDRVAIRRTRRRISTRCSAASISPISRRRCSWSSTRCQLDLVRLRRDGARHGIALLPDRRSSSRWRRCRPKRPATTVAAAVAFTLAAAATCAPAGDGARPDTRSSYYARTPFEKQMQHEIVCTVRRVRHQTLAECRKDPCPVSHEMRGQLAAMIDAGMNDHDKIIQAFIAKYGSEEMLGAPVDRGFSRLAWLFPYLVGATSAVVVGIAAVKWTRKPDAAPASAATLDPALEERIDDELRDLD
jgi:cytochrome c-type biogenesis protein CcmF